jgi:hypothetical protein
MAPPPVSLFDLLKLVPLFVGKIDCDFLVRLRHELVDALARVAPYLTELRSRFIDNWGNFCDLLRRQLKLSAKALFHSIGHPSWTVNVKEKMPSVKSPQSSASDSASDEYKNESGNKFPLQRAVHCENSS